MNQKQAIILAAGFGSRLSPLTFDVPKAMIKINEKTLLEWVIEYLASFNISRIIINVHHLGNVLIPFIQTLKYSNIELIISDETMKLKDTGGALVTAQNLFWTKSPILIYNTDIITNLNLDILYNIHEGRGSDATLVVSERESDRKLVFDNYSETLVGWTKTSTNETIGPINKIKTSKLWSFSGIHIINQNMISQFKLQYQNEPFSIINAYLTNMEGFQIRNYEIPKNIVWLEAGNIERLEYIRNLFVDDPTFLNYPKP